MFHNHPVVGKIDVVCNFLGKSHLMGNEDAGHSFLGQFLDGDQDLFHRLGIKGRGDLVKKHHIGIHRQGPCDRNTLLLSSGELSRVTVFLALQADFTDQILRTFPDLFLVLLQY